MNLGWLVLDAGKTESVLGLSPRWTLSRSRQADDGLVSLLLLAMSTHENFVSTISNRSHAEAEFIAYSGAMTG